MARGLDNAGTAASSSGTIASSLPLTFSISGGDAAPFVFDSLPFPLPLPLPLRVEELRWPDSSELDVALL